MKKTVLYDEHVRLGAKIVEYAGYLMPVEYSGLTPEHLAVRTTCGLFDVSHMGEILIEGKETKAFVNYLATCAVPTKQKRMVYGMMLKPNGGIVDDLMMYYFHDEKIILVVNASNLEKDLVWVQEQSQTFDVKITDLSPQTSQLALQGRGAESILQTLTDTYLGGFKMYDFAEIIVNNNQFLVSRSGYTGEDGFEIYGSAPDILALFRILIDKGVTPCGLGARDTLRFEANLPLYGHEIGITINPLEATLTFACAFEKDFIGRDALIAVKEKGLKRKVVALELKEKGIARADYEVVNQNGENIGYITTGYLVPGGDKAVALAMLQQGYWDLGTIVGVRIRKNVAQAVVRNKKFLNKVYKK